MNNTVRLLCLLAAAIAAGPAVGQALDEPVRLRLALDPDGSVRLSADPVPYAPPPLLQQQLPRLAPGSGNGGGGLAIDLSAARSDSVELAPCLADNPLRLGAIAACEPLAYVGLPGALAGADLRISFEPGAGYGIELSYGLDWLDGTQASGLGAWPHLTGDLPPAGNQALLLPGWVGPLQGGASLHNQRIGLGGFVWLGPDLRLGVGLEHAEGSTLLFHPGAAPWSMARQDSLSLGFSYGRLQGALIGRQLRPDGSLGAPAANDSLDLGFSWRMPWWNAALEFGARNLIVRPQQPEREDLQPEQGDLRVPYLRYHQEL